ncbi:hypothetical protein, partial [Kaarinaea lacus]
MASEQNDFHNVKQQSSGAFNRLLVLCIVFGISVGVAFFAYGNLLGNWEGGQKNWFVSGCIVGGIVFGYLNYWLFHKLYLSNLHHV